eukprot:jgi/Tetstr1/434969/TSEL_023960.t1
MIEIKLTKPITTSHSLAEIHHIVTFLKSFCESELINLIVVEMKILMVIQKGHSPLKDSNKVHHEIEDERGRMLDTVTGMFIVKGSEVPLDFNTVSIITVALGFMCKRAVNMVPGTDTNGVATNIQASKVIAKMTYPPDHADEYDMLT